MGIFTHFERAFPVDTLHTAAVIQTDSAVRQWQGFYVPSEMSLYLCSLKNDERQHARTHTHTCTHATRMHMRIEVLVLQTFLAGLADPEAEVISHWLS